MVIELNHFNYLLDNDPVNNDSSYQDDQNIQEPSSITEPDNSNQEPTEPDNSEPSTEPDNQESEDVLTSFLKSYGLEDGRTVTFENEDGTTEQVEFSSLSQEEQLNILKEITAPGLTEDEINTINYLRRNNASLQDVAEYYKKKGIEEYISENGPVEKHYSIDDYSEDELYLANLKEKYPDMTDDDLQSELEIAKSNDELFKKKIDIIKKQYKEQEDKQAEEAKLESERQFNDFKNTIHSSLEKFNEISTDYRDNEAPSLEIEDAEKERIFSYILDVDADGMSQFFKDLNNPDVLVELAWHRLFGKDAISGVTQYWKEQLKERSKSKEKETTKSDQSVTTVIPKTPDNKPNQDKTISSYYKSLL